MRYGYNSPSTPTSTYDYDVATRERTLRKVQEVPSGHDATDYVVERLNAPAPDGELVPVTVLRRKSTPVDGSAPLLLYGYGSYGIPMAASFSACEKRSCASRHSVTSSPTVITCVTGPSSSRIGIFERR